MLRVAVTLALAAFAAGCSKESDFRQVGYFKSGNNDRIMTVAFAPGAGPAEARAYAEKLPHTAGRMLAAYFYPEGAAAPADGVTLASSVISANEALAAPGAPEWVYAYMRAPAGD